MAIAVVGVEEFPFFSCSDNCIRCEHSVQWGRLADWYIMCSEKLVTIHEHSSFIAFFL